MVVFIKKMLLFVAIRLFYEISEISPKLQQHKDYPHQASVLWFF